LSDIGLAGGRLEAEMRAGRAAGGGRLESGDGPLEAEVRIERAGPSCR
jgi:hypothetical protein